MFHITTPPQHEVYRHAKAGNVDKVKYWVEEQNFPVDQKDFYSCTLLYYSCLCDHPIVAQYLLKRGAAFSRNTSDGRRTFLASSSLLRDVLSGRPLKDEKVKTAVQYVEKWHITSLNNPLFSDVTFMVDGKNIFSHKAILAARCPGLIPRLESKNAISMGHSIKEDLFSNFLKFVYTDKIALKPSQQKDLLQMAHRLGLQGLANICKPSEADTSELFSMGHTMLTMFNNPLFSDITLTTDNGTSFFAHKVILANRCDYFKTIFSSEFIEKDSSTLQLHDIPDSILHIIISYIYSGFFAVDENNILEALVAADKLLLTKLKDDLQIIILRDYLDAESCMELLGVCDMIACDKLFNACVCIILNNQATMLHTDEFKSLKSSTQIHILAKASKR